MASDPDLARYSNRSNRYSEDQLDPDSEAAFLFRSIKVFCLVFPTNAGVTEILYFGGSLNRHKADGIPYSFLTGGGFSSHYFFKTSIVSFVLIHLNSKPNDFNPGPDRCDP